MLDDLFAPAPDQVLGVTDLTRQIKQRLEGDFGRVWVKGEVSNLRRQSSGHVYFSMKDCGSLLPSVLFAKDAAQQSFELEDGMELILFGNISVYEPHGRYQLIGKVAIKSGEGRLQLAFEKLKRQLATEGLFDSERKKPLPVLPKRIAVITSPTGAALKDFLRILKRRQFGGNVIIFPARVQGKEAPEEILGMLQHATASEGFDLIVLTRGGGSIEDLWAFNNEKLARAVVDCSLPVISAIGHEIDHVLTDFAADRRAETPSGAAELISSLYLDALQRLNEGANSLQLAWENYIEREKARLEQLAARMRIIAPERQIELLGMRLDDLENRLSGATKETLQKNLIKLNQLDRALTRHHPESRLQLLREKVENRSTRMRRAARSGLKYQNQILISQQKRLKNNDIQATLRRGYTILKDDSGTILESAASVEKAQSIVAKMEDGEVELRPKN